MSWVSRTFTPPLLKIFGAFGADYDDNYNRLWYTHNHASAAGENFELLASEMMIFYWIFSEKPQNFSPQAPLAQALDNFYPPLLDRPHPQGGGVKVEGGATVDGIQLIEITVFRLQKCKMFAPAAHNHVSVHNH